MSVSGAKAAVEINLDEFERRLRAAGAPQMGVEDPLAELTRLVESSKAPAANPPPSANVISGLGRIGREAPPLVETAPPVETTPPVEASPLRPALDEAKDDHRIEKRAEQVEPPQAEDAKEFLGHDPKPAEPVAPRGDARWKLTVSALALAGAAMIGAVFLMRGGVPGLPKAPPFIAAAQGPTKVKPPSDETVAASNEAGASLMKDTAPPAQVKVVNSEEQPVDLNAQAASLNAAPPPAAGAPTTTGSTQPASADVFASASAAAPNGSPVAATVNTPVVAPAAPAPPPLASQFPDPRPVRTVSLRPDGTPIPTPASPAADAAQPSPAAEAPAPAAKPAPKATKNDAAGIAQPSTPKLELPAKPAKSSARVVVAKTDTTAPGAAAETPSQPLQLGGPAKAEKTPKPPKPAQAAAEPPAAAPAAPAAAAQQPDNPIAPIAHALSSLVGGPAATAAPAPQPVDPTAATTSGGWAVQLAAPKSEAEAKSDLERLNAKYASALNGSTIGVHKASVNGETVYRLRVVGLTKADAAALCARLKGDGGACFIAK